MVMAWAVPKLAVDVDAGPGEPFRLDSRHGSTVRQASRALALRHAVMAEWRRSCRRAARSGLSSSKTASRALLQMSRWKFDELTGRRCGW